jgi:hypothetical protein
MSIAEMCALAELSRAGYYRFLATPLWSGKSKHSALGQSAGSAKDCGRRSEREKSNSAFLIPIHSMRERLAGLRARQQISVSTSGQETVVPVAVKLISPELEFGHLLVGNLQSRRIGIGVELAFHRQACGGGSGGNKVDDDLVTD